MMEGGAKKKGTNGGASLQDTSKKPSSSPFSSSSTSLSSIMSLDSGDDGGPIGRETRRRLVEWWSREYCAGRMRLCVIGKGVILYSGLTIASLMQTPKIRWIICLIWQPIYSRPYQIMVRILYPRFRIILLALTRKAYVSPLPRISELVTDSTSLSGLGLRADNHGLPCHGDGFSDRRTDLSLALQAGWLSREHNRPRRSWFAALVLEGTWLDHVVERWCTRSCTRHGTFQNNVLSVTEWVR
jgi:hypothetical protein